MKLALLILLIPSIHLTANYLFIQWWIGATLLSIPCGYFVYKRTSMWLGLFFSYVVSYFAYIAYSHTGRFINIPQHDKVSYVAISAATVLIMFLFVVGLSSLKKKHLETLISAIPYYGVINALYVCIGYLFKFGKLTNSMGYSGFLENSSLNSNLIAYSLVYILCTRAFSKQRALLAVPCLCAIFLSRSSIAYGILATGITAYWFSERVFKKEVFLKVAGIFTAIICIGFLTEGYELFDSAKRLEAYSLFLSHWQVNYPNMFGSGPGTFAILSPGISRAHKFMVSGDTIWLWHWMHSEFLQELFQTGWLGFTLIVGAVLDLAWKLFKSHNSLLLALFLSVVGGAVFNFPARYFPIAFVSAIIIAACYRSIDLRER